MNSDWGGEVTPSIDIKTLIEKRKVIVKGRWSSGSAQSANNASEWSEAEEYWTSIENSRPWKRKEWLRSNHKLACSGVTVILRQHKLLSHSAGWNRTAYLKVSSEIWKDVITRKKTVLNQNQRNTRSDGRGIVAETNQDKRATKQGLSV